MAIMWTVIIKNNSGSIKTIEDLGLELADGSTSSLSNQFTYPQLAESDDLRTLVGNGDLVVNNGTGDLSAPDGVKYLTINGVYQTEGNFYTQTELQTSGNSAVHWDNITNAPSFGASSWGEPVLARAVAVQSAQPIGVEGDFFVDTDDNHLYKFLSGVWVDQGVPTTGERVINLDSTAQVVYEYSGSSWVLQPDPADNSGVLVGDDGDGKQAQYVYDLAELKWVKIADIDFGAPNTLGGAYNEGGSGVGRVINAVSGAVKLDAGASTNAPFEITEKASLPTTGLAAGQMAVKGGLLFVYDASRSKWLSVERMYITFGRKGNTKNQYLNFGAGTLASNNSGLRIPRDSCIVAMSAQLDITGTSNFRVRKNDNAANIETLLVNAAVGSHVTTLNTDISAGDFLQCYSDNASDVEDPIVLVEIAYRG